MVTLCRQSRLPHWKSLCIHFQSPRKCTWSCIHYSTRILLLKVDVDSQSVPIKHSSNYRAGPAMNGRCATLRGQNTKKPPLDLLSRIRRRYTIVAADLRLHGIRNSSETTCAGALAPTARRSGWKRNQLSPQCSVLLRGCCFVLLCMSGKFGLVRIYNTL